MCMNVVGMFPLAGKENKGNYFSRESFLVPLL